MASRLSANEKRRWAAISNTFQLNEDKCNTNDSNHTNPPILWLYTISRVRVCLHSYAWFSWIRCVSVWWTSFPAHYCLIALHSVNSGGHIIIEHTLKQNKLSLLCPIKPARIPSNWNQWQMRHIWLTHRRTGAQQQGTFNIMQSKVVCTYRRALSGPTDAFSNSHREEFKKLLNYILGRMRARITGRWTTTTTTMILLKLYKL